MELIPHSKPWLVKEDFEAVNQVLNSKIIAKNGLVGRFEEEIANYLGVNSSVATTSGTAALKFALTALEISRGDEVILPTYVCGSVANAIESVEAIPVFCDIGEDWNMNANSVESCITDRTKAIIVVHIFGIPAEINEIKKFGIPVIEDCCQAFGLEIGSMKTGTIGDIGFYSFHATKCLTTGEGGAVISADPYLAEKLKELQFKEFIPSKLSDLQAALGLSQLKRYKKMLEKRTTIANKYFNYLPKDWVFEVQKLRKQALFFRFPLTVDIDFDELKQKFEKNRIAIRKGVDQLLHKKYKLSDQKFNLSCQKFDKTVSIPIYPALLEEEVDKIIEITNKLYHKYDNSRIR